MFLVGVIIVGGNLEIGRTLTNFHFQNANTIPDLVEKLSYKEQAKYLKEREEKNVLQLS